MRLLVGLIAALGVASALTAPAAAFGRDGHEAVCAIAYEHLTNDARREVDRLIALDPAYDRFRDVCSWADVVRGTTHKETAPYHYMGLSLDDETVDYTDCSPRGCVISAIVKDGTILADRSRSDQDRLEALKFLAHWIGDVHQPLHVSINREPADRGGNDNTTLWRGARNSNFHRMWDSELILDYMAERWRYLPEDERIDQFTIELLSELTIDGVTVKAPLDPVPWAQESHDYARSRDLAYRYADTQTVYTPGADYYERHIPDIKKRLKQGGVRLAAVLNRMFEDGPSS